MIRLALQSLRFRLTSAIGTFLAVFLGATAVFAFGALMETGIRGEVAPQRLAAAPVVITGQQTFDIAKHPGADDDDTETAVLAERVRIPAATLSAVAAVPGVQQAIGDVSFPLAVDGHDAPGRMLGHTYGSTALAPYRLAAGTAPHGADQVALDPSIPGIEVGERMAITVAGVPHTYRVSGLVVPPAPTRDGAVFFDDQVALALSGHQQSWDAIGVLTDPGATATLPGLTAAISDAAGQGTTVLTGAKRGLAEFGESLGASNNLVLVAAVAGGNSIAVAAFVIFATLGLAIQQRQRELALLRAVGTTPRQLRRMVIGEAAAIAVVAAAVGWLPGRWLARWLFDQLAGHGVVPQVLTFTAGWIPIVVAAGAAVFAAVLAATFVARRAAVVRPTEALAVPGESRRWLTTTRAVIGGLAIAGGVALIIVTLTVFDGPIAASTAGPSVFLWALAMAMMSPGLTKLLAKVIGAPLRLFGGAGYLATVNAAARPVRTAAAVTPIMLAVGLATGMIYLQTTSADVEQRAYADSLRADAVVTAGPGGLPPALRTQIDALPQVAQASNLVASTVYIETPVYGGQDEDGLAAQGLDSSAAGRVTSAEATAGSLDRLSGNTIALPAEVAAGTGVGVGGSVTIRFGDGAIQQLTVVAITADQPIFTGLLFPADLLAAHTATGRADTILLTGAPGVDRVALRSAVDSAIDGAPGIVVGNRDSLTAQHHDQQQVGAWVQYLILGVLTLYTVLSIVNSVIIGTVRRRREFGLQRLTGSTRGQVLRMTAIEATLAAVIGIVLGTLVSGTTLVPFSLLVKGSMMPSGPIGVYLAIVASGFLLAWAATLIPTWRVTRGRPAEAALADSD